MSEVPGPDGYLPRVDDHLLAAQRRLSDFLFAEEQRNPALTPFPVSPWRKLKRAELVQQVEAVLERIFWLYEHDAELEQAHWARLRLANLLHVLHRAKSAYTEQELCRALDLTNRLLGSIAPYGPVERVVDYLRDHDLTPALCDALRRFQGNLREEMSISQASMQSLRQTLHVLLWLDEWDPLDPKRCWSECVRRDFRAMEGERRLKWRALLKHVRGNAPVRMPAGWARPAEGLLASVGADDFREQIRIWFAPLHLGEPLPLSVAGSHVLKGLIWYCAVSRDPELAECASWLLEARWKQQRNTEKVLTALSVFGITKEELLARQLIKPAGPPPALRLIEQMAHAAAPRVMDHVRTDGDVLIVQGQMYFYRVHRVTGQIERAGDDVILDVNWAEVPDQLRLILHRECDSEHQAALRASLLVHDGVFGRYFKPR